MPVARQMTEDFIAEYAGAPKLPRRGAGRGRGRFHGELADERAQAGSDLRPHLVLVEAPLDGLAACATEP